VLAPTLLKGGQAKGVWSPICKAPDPFMPLPLIRNSQSAIMAFSMPLPFRPGGPN